MEERQEWYLKGWNWVIEDTVQSKGICSGDFQTRVRSKTQDREPVTRNFGGKRGPEGIVHKTTSVYRVTENRVVLDSIRVSEDGHKTCPDHVPSVTVNYTNVYLLTYPPTSPPTYLFTHLSIPYLPIYLPTYLPVFFPPYLLSSLSFPTLSLFPYLSNYLRVHPITYSPPTNLLIYLLTYQPIYLLIYLPT